MISRLKQNFLNPLNSFSSYLPGVRNSEKDFLFLRIYRLYFVTARLADAPPFGFGGVVLAMGVTFIAFEGYEVIAGSSEEVRDPKRTLPRALLLAVVFV